MFTFERRSGYEILSDLACGNDEMINEKAEKCLEYFFSDDEDEDYLFLEERLENDPELTRKIQEEMAKNPPPQDAP